MLGGRLDTLQLNDLLARWRAGDIRAREELLRAAYPRLELLARRMMRGFPNVRPVHDTQDVLQNAAVRLTRSLQQLNPPPGSTREFFGLAATEIRRELLDLARACATSRQAVEGLPLHEATRDWHTADDLERWTAFHEAVDRLPVEEREVVGLLFYHGWTQAQAAELFGVSERTIARRWHAACLRLQTQLGDRLPEG